MAVRTLLPRAKKAAKSEGAPVNTQEVAEVAYALYVQRGRCDGFDRQDWFEAEKIVRQGRGMRR